MITTPIFTRIMTSSEYGQFNVFYSWLGIISIFVCLNLYCGVYEQGVVKFDRDRKVFSSSLQGLTLSLAIIWLVIYFSFSSFWNSLFSLTTFQMVCMLIIIWETAAFSFWVVEQRVLLNYKVLVFITFISSLLQPIISILFMSFMEDKVTARILGITVVEVLFYTPFVFKQFYVGKIFFSKRYWKYSVLFNLPLIPHYLSQTVLNSSDRIMIEKMVGSSEAGIYSLAYSISNIMLIFNTAMLQTLNPWIYRKIKEKRVYDITRIVYVALCCIAIVNVLLIFFGPEIVAVFGPDEYSNAKWIVPPVAMSVFFVFCYSIFADFEFYYQKTHLIMTASIVGAILNIILNYIFINIFGYYAAGYTTLACYMIYCLGHYIFMKKIVKENIGEKPIFDQYILLMITICFLTVGFLLMFTYELILVRYGIIGVILILCAAFRKKIKPIIQLLISIKKNQG